MQYITINNYSIPYPNDFTMAKVPYKVSQLTLMNGKNIADVIGWKYDTTTLQWDTLIDSDLNNLLSAISPGEFEIQFVGLNGTTETINAVLESRVSTKTRFTWNGRTIHKDIQVTLSFPDCYQ